MQDTLRAKFLGQFVETAQTRTAASAAAVREDAASTASHELHALAGECSMLGFEDMGTMARDAEAIAKAWEAGDASSRVKCGRAVRLLQRAVQELVSQTANPTEPVPEAEHQSDHERRVLIVDDSEIVADQLQELFDDQSISSRIATTLEQATREASDFAPAVVLLDLNMPGVKSEDMVKGLRESCASARILLVSGVSDEELATRNGELGTSGYVSKQDGVSRVIDYVAEQFQGRTE